MSKVTTRSQEQVADQPSQEAILALSEEDIAQRAYALYLARGCEDGHDVADWLQAQQEILEERNRTDQHNAA